MPTDEPTQLNAKQRSIQLGDVFNKEKSFPTSSEAMNCHFATGGELALKLCRQLEQKKARMFETCSHLSELWSCGQNSYGELCQGDTISRHELCRAPCNDNIDIKQVAAGVSSFL